MARKRKKKSWAGFPLLVGVLGLVAFTLAFVFRRDLVPQVMAGVTALLGIAFLWAFAKPDVWWAVIPGAGCQRCCWGSCRGRSELNPSGGTIAMPVWQSTPLRRSYPQPISYHPAPMILSRRG